MNVLITVTFNAMKHAILEPFLASVAEQRGSEIRLIVIDNASDDGTLDYLNSIRDPRVTVIANDRNVGFAAACNQGIALARAANADFVTFINNDTIFDPSLMSGMEDSLLRAGVDALTPLITYEALPNRIWFATGSFRWLRGMIPYHEHINSPISAAPGEVTPIAFAPGCCLLMRMDLFRRIGEFDERYFVYWEDADFCMSMKRHGASLVVDPALRCHHKVSISTGGAFSDFSVRHFNRGHMLFVLKHFGWWSLAPILPIVAAKALLNALRSRLSWRQIPLQINALCDGMRAAIGARGSS